MSTAPPELDQLAQRLPLDELHRQVTAAMLRADLLDGDDVGMAEQAAHLALMTKGLLPLDVFGVPAAQHLDGDDLPGVPIDGPKDAGERPGPDLIEDRAATVEESEPVAAHEPLELVAGEEFPTHERRTEGLRRRAAAPGLTQPGLQLQRRNEFEFEDRLRELLRCE
jgi:hypothetical protein